MVSGEWEREVGVITVEGRELSSLMGERASCFGLSASGGVFGLLFWRSARAFSVAVAGSMNEWSMSKCSVNSLWG